MSVQYACDRCGAVTDAEAAVGWVELRPLGGRPLRAPEASQLCAACWAAMAGGAGPVTHAGGGAVPQLSEHTQNRDTVQ